MIVPVTPDTLQAWARMSAALYGDTAEEMLEYSKTGHPYEFVYMKEGKAIAVLSLDLRDDYVEGTSSSPVGYIEGIYVEPEHRKSGFARELIEFAKSWSKENGCKEMASDCYLENNYSRIFHNAVGFTEAGINVHFTMDL